MVQAIPSGAYSVIYNAQDVAGFDLGYSYEDLAGNYSAVAYLGSCSASYIAHTAQSLGVQAVVSSGGGVNVNPSGGTSGNLPYSNQSAQVSGVISSGTSLNVNPSGGVSNTLPYVNHASGVTNVIGSSGDYDASKARTGTNLPYNSNSLGALASFTSFGQLYGIGATWNASAGIGGATNTLASFTSTTVNITIPAVSGSTPQYVVFAQWNTTVYYGILYIYATGSALSSIDNIGQATDVQATSGGSAHGRVVFERRLAALKEVWSH